MNTNALERVEGAVDLLRELNSAEWLLYALGAAPLSVAVLLLVRDAAAGYGQELCLRDSLLCAGAFFWASFWKARFAGALLDRLGKMADSRRSAVWECALVQGVLQSFKLSLLPLAAVSIVPMAWFSALFRNVSIEVNRPGVSVGGALRAAAARATYGGRQNWIALLICTVGGFVVFVNVLVVVLMLPRLLETFTGAANEWTRGYLAGGNVGLLAIAMTITWLVIDPVLQAYAVVGWFYFEARKDGRDLLVRLRRAAAPVLLGCVFVGSFGGMRAVKAKPGPGSPTFSVEDVRRGVEEAKSSREYAWLRATATKAGSDDWFASRILRDWKRAMGALGSFFDRLGKWLDKLFGKKKENSDAGYRETRANGGSLRWLLYAGAVLCVVVTVVLIVQRSRGQTPLGQKQTGIPVATSASVEDALASERPNEEWLTLAREFGGRGEWRSAIRAMYLANLSYLGAAELLRITKSKSNALYERELRNRCRTESVCVAFTRSNREYEKVWYGMHEVTPELRESFEDSVMAIRAHA